MITASVVGPVWATKRVDGLPPGALLEVQELGSDRRLVALDQLGAGRGDHVLIALGSAVTRHLPGNPPLDAMVVGVIDDITNPTATDSVPARTSKERKSTK
jgi:ethanolamine utilization protein EutN